MRPSLPPVAGQGPGYGESKTYLPLASLSRSDAATQGGLVGKSDDGGAGTATSQGNLRTAASSVSVPMRSVSSGSGASGWRSGASAGSALSSSSASRYTSVQFPHPYKPYPIQQEFMGKLYEALKESKVAILESPTGTVRIVNPTSQPERPCLPSSASQTPFYEFIIIKPFILLLTLLPLPIPFCRERL